MRRRAWAFALALAATTALADGRPAMTEAEEAHALIGIEYTSRLHGERITSRLSCTDQGGGLLHGDDISHDEWSHGLATCQGRTVVILRRAIGEVNGRTTWRIADTLLLPPVQLDPAPERPNALRLFGTGDCELDGRTDTFFITLVRWGKHDRIDWRSGVERAWTFDIKRGRIVPLSTRRIACYRPEPA
jgi:hypothetical protein